jgi:hypothetical protein
MTFRRKLSAPDKNDSRTRDRSRPIRPPIRHRNLSTSMRLLLVLSIVANNIDRSSGDNAEPQNGSFPSVTSVLLRPVLCSTKSTDVCWGFSPAAMKYKPCFATTKVFCKTNPSTMRVSSPPAVGMRQIDHRIPDVSLA